MLPKNKATMERKGCVITMGFNYNLTAAQILQELGYKDPVAKEALIQQQQEKNIRLPSVLFEFLCLASDCPLLATADIGTESQAPFSTLYEEIQEMIDEDQEYWEEHPDDPDNSEYYQYYKLPREQWESRVPDYLLIGSDYGAGVVSFGIRLSDLDQDDPPVYMNHECDAIADWKLWSKSLSGYLMMALCDALCCGEYKTAARALEEQGWAASKLTREDFTRLIPDPSAMLKELSLYGTESVCGCAYDGERKILVAVRADRKNEGYFYGMEYRKQNGETQNV